jgi:hypothetical protein
MSSVVIAGNTSGTITLSAPAVAGTNTVTLPASTGTVALTSDISSAVPAGTIIMFAGTTAPSGYLICPTTATTVSRTTYSALFSAIGTTWGAGDGSTTFNIPAFTADFAPIQASSNVGTTSTGSVISHNHSVITTSTGGNGSIGAAVQVALNTPGNTGSTGGTNNLAAGARVLFCVKY